jgi:hypothetical protein
MLTFSVWQLTGLARGSQGSGLKAIVCASRGAYVPARDPQIDRLGGRRGTHARRRSLEETRPQPPRARRTNGRGEESHDADTMTVRGKPGRCVGVREIAGAMDKMLPEVPDKPLEQQSDAELFAGNFRRSLLFSRRVLDRPDDWDNVEFMKTKREVALAVQGQAVRLRAAELAPRADDSVVERLMRRVAAIRRGEKVIEIDPGDVSE